MITARSPTRSSAACTRTSSSWPGTSPDTPSAYAHSGNPPFIPEVRLDARTPSEAVYAIGAHDAIGFSPFAIESATDSNATRLGAAYEMLGELSPLILREQGQGKIFGAIPHVSFDGTVNESPQRIAISDAVIRLAPGGFSMQLVKLYRYR